MPFVILGMAGIGAMSRTNPARAKRWSRWLLGGGACFIGAVMTLRGLAVLGAPIIGVGLVMLGISARGPARSESSQQAPRGHASAMSRREALETLGLEDGASEEDIRAAYKSLMKRLHPDAGGSDALARQIQEARDTLLPRR